MEEKKSSKSSILVVILGIALIAIIIMGVFIYKLTNERNIEIQRATDLQAEANDLNNTVSELQAKIDKVSEAIGSDTSKDNTSDSKNEVAKDTVNNDTSKVSNDDVVKENLQKYLNLIGALAGSPRNVLEELGLLNLDDFSGEQVDVEGVPYVTTKIKYSTFKDTMLQYMSEKCFENEFSRFYKSFDWVYYRDSGATGRAFEVLSVTKINDSEYTAKVNEIMDDGSKEAVEYKVKVVNNNGKVVIDSCE